ncbi:MAG: hypothetical protein RSB55_07575, partial [Oscillospiraceae bacterium]
MKKMDDMIICSDSVNISRVLKSYRSAYSGSAAVCTTELELATALAQAARRAARCPDTFLEVRTGEGIRFCPLSDILYCRSVGHRFHVFLADGSDFLSNNARCRFFQSVEVLLTDRRFAQCGRA